MEINIGDFCAVCTLTPHTYKRKMNLQKCKKSKEYVTPFCICKHYDASDQKKAKRMGGMRSAMAQREI